MWKTQVLLAVAFLYAVSAQPTMRRKVIIDVDTGSDDAMAMFLLLSKYSSVDVIAVTCVSGNTGTSNVTNNVLKIMAITRRFDIPVFEGSPQGLVYEEKSDGFWGTDGLGDFSALYQVDRSQVRREHAALALGSLVQQYPKQITILALGPLTNIALARHITRNFFDLMNSLIILGGSYQGSGNVKPGVEFNMYADPEAAAYVFSQVKPYHSTILIPTETVERAALPLSYRLNVLGAIRSPAMDFLNKAEQKAIPKMGNEWFYFDQTAASVLLQPSVVEQYTQAKIIVETGGVHARGAMFIDGKATVKPITIITQVNVDSIKQIFLRNLSG